MTRKEREELASKVMLEMFKIVGKDIIFESVNPTAVLKELAEGAVVATDALIAELAK